MSLGLLVEEYLDHLSIERNLSQRTTETYRYDLRKWLAFMGRVHADVEISHITTEHIREYLYRNLQLTNSAVSITKRISTLRGYFKFLVERKRITQSPMDPIRLPKLPQRLPIYLTAEELHLLFTAIPNGQWRDKRNKAMIVLMAMTGIRLTELVSLNVSHVQMTPPNGSEDYVGSIRVCGKGAKERMVPLNMMAVDVLRVYLNARPPVNNDAMFINKFGKRITRRTVQKILAKCAIKAGINRIRVSPHKLRHTFATLLHEGEIDIVEIQKLLGHSSLASTMIYTHTNTKRLQKAVDRLERVCNGNH